MKLRLYFIILAVLQAVSVPVGAAVISINVESNESGQTITHMYGDVTGSFVTGTNTQWNLLQAGDSDGYAFRATTDVLGTMDGSTIQNDVKFTIVGSAGKVGRLWAQQDYIFCQDSGSNKIDEYEFSYTGLIAGESYDLLFRVNRSYTQITIDGVTKTSSFSTNMLTFNGAVADGNGVITGYLRENPATSEADKLFWMQIKGAFDVFTPASTVRPMIKANEADKIRFLGLIDDGYDKAINCLNNLESGISGDITAHQASPANFIAGAPRIKDSAEGVAGVGVHSHINWGQRASNAGRAYFITGEEKYAQCAADMLNHYVQELGYIDRTPQASSDGDQRDYRDVYVNIATCYDYIRNFLVQPGTTVYDAKSGTDIAWDDDKAQIMFKNIVERGFQVSNGVSNITVMEIDSILYSALCIEDTNIRYTTVKDVVNRASGLSMMKQVMVQNNGIWPESSSYNGVGAGIPNLMRVVDRIYPEYHLFDGYQAALNGALDRSYYVYPSEQEMFCFGDAHRAHSGPIRNEDRLPVVRYLDASDRYRDSFSEVIARYYSQLLAEREKYGYNPSDPWNVDELVGYEANFEVTHSVVHPYAGLAMQDNVNCTDPVMNGLKYYQGGASYVHSHLTGIDLELYGAGVVMSGVGGAGIDVVDSRGDDLFINYYRRYAGHNTVVVNAESLGLTSGWKGYDYNCMNTVKLVSMEPEPYAPPVSDWFTFSCQKLNDTASDATQQRTVGIVRTGDTSGYYIDLFRSRQNNDNRFHDYIYHNIGDSLVLTSGGAAVPLQQDTQVNKQYVDPRDSSNPDMFDYQDWTRYPSVPMMPVGSSKNYLLTFPGWNFFKQVNYSAEIDTPVVGRFDMTISNIDRYMHVNMPGGVGREYTYAQAPVIIEGAGGYDKKNSKVLSIRQNGEAWDRPFVVVFEPSTNAAPTVQSVENIIDNGRIVGARVVSSVGDKLITDLIIAHDSANATYTNLDDQIEFTGRYAVARTIEGAFSNEVHLYIGDGQSLSFQGHTLTAGDDNSACQSYSVGTGGKDMITWSGQGVEMAPSYGNGYSPSFWKWSADPADGVEFSPDAWAENPTVTITKATENPSVVTLTVTANDGTGPVTDTITIDVYDDACKAAIGAGVGVNYPTDHVEDCVINFEDLATMALNWLIGADLEDFNELALTWLEDYSLEEPVVK